MNFDGKVLKFEEAEVQKIQEEFKESNIHYAERHDLTHTVWNGFGYKVKKGNLTFEFCSTKASPEVCNELLIHGLGYENVKVVNEDANVLYSFIRNIIKEREEKVNTLSTKSEEEKQERFKANFFDAFKERQNLSYDLRDRRAVGAT